MLSSASGLPWETHSIVMNCALVTVTSGLNASSPVPAVMPCSTAHATALS